MLNDNYERALNKIKRDLSMYSHSSVFDTAIAYLSRPLSKGEDFYFRMPWVVMFLLKQKFLGESGSRKITTSQFVGFASRVFKLSDSIANVPSEVLFLMMRSMMGQQQAYQVPSYARMQALMMQWTLMSGDDEFYEELFFNKTGVKLRNYYLMSLYLFSQVFKVGPNEVVKYSLRTFFLHFTPSVSPKEISNFLAPVGVPFGGLPDFMRKHKVVDSNTAELYQDSPFKFKPVLLFDEGVVIYSPALYMQGIKAIVYEVMKREGAFNSRFGTDVELYLGRIFKSAFKQFWPIEELKGVISLKKGKKADYVIRDGNNVLIVESKAIEPSELARCAYDPASLKKYLSDSFLKGIGQGLETAHKLKLSGKFDKCNFFVFIVTVEDFSIFGGEFVEKFLDDGLFERVRELYGYLPVFPEDVIYITINDVVGVASWLANNPDESISNLIVQAKKKKSEDQGIFAPTLAGVLQAEVLQRVPCAAGIEDALDTLEREISQTLDASKDFWSGKVIEFVHLFPKFQALLAQTLRE